MAMSEKDRKQLLVLMIILGLGAPVAFWIYWRNPVVLEVQAMQNSIDSLQARIDTARADLAQGTVESLRAQVSQYERALDTMRELVPVGEEVTALIDSVSTQADLRGVEILSLQPQSPELSSPFETHRYRFTVVGPFDQVGEFLTDIASLRRIMVPYDVTLNRANDAELSGLLIDEDATYLRVGFMIRTFVKGSQGAGAGD